MPASPLGKIKMVAQVVAILALILGTDHLHGFFVIGQVALWVVVVTALVSAADYFRRFNTILSPRVADFRLPRTRRATPASADVRVSGSSAASAWRRRRRLELGDPLLRLAEILALLELLDQLLEVGQRLGLALHLDQRLAEVEIDAVAAR